MKIKKEDLLLLKDLDSRIKNDYIAILSTLSGQAKTTIYQNHLCEVIEHCLKIKPLNTLRNRHNSDNVCENKPISSRIGLKQSEYLVSVTSWLINFYLIMEDEAFRKEVVPHIQNLIRCFPDVFIKNVEVTNAMVKDPYLKALLTETFLNDFDILFDMTEMEAA